MQPPNAMTTRGSVASLPDSSTIRPQPLHGVDPFVTIDALVAELELNTDQVHLFMGCEAVKHMTFVFHY